MSRPLPMLLSFQSPPEALLHPDIQRAARALAQGEFVLLFDQEGREEETDLLIAAEHCTPTAVHRLRRDAGGLIFVAVDGAIGELFGLPFAHDVHEAASPAHPLLRHVVNTGLPYDARSSFSLWVNHRQTFTGITDVDRAKTIRELPLAAADADGLDRPEAMALFGDRFRSPGHVSLCVGHGEGPLGRQGHTELATALARIAGITPIVAGCEMLHVREARPPWWASKKVSGWNGVGSPRTSFSPRSIAWARFRATGLRASSGSKRVVAPSLVSW